MAVGMEFLSPAKGPPIRPDAGGGSGALGAYRFTWKRTLRELEIQNRTGGTMYGKWDPDPAVATSVSATDWDFILEDGKDLFRRQMLSTLDVYFASAWVNDPGLGKNCAINGWV